MHVRNLDLFNFNRLLSESKFNLWCSNLVSDADVVVKCLAALSLSLVSLSPSSDMLLMTFPRTKHPLQPRPSQHSSQWAMSISAWDEGLTPSDNTWQMDYHFKFWSFFCCFDVLWISFYWQFKFDWFCQMPVLMVSSRLQFDSQVPILSQLIVTIIFVFLWSWMEVTSWRPPDDPSIIMHLGQARVHSHNDTMHAQHPCRAPYCSMLLCRLMQLTRPCRDQDLCFINQEQEPISVFRWQFFILLPYSLLYLSVRYNAYSTWQ